MITVFPRVTKCLFHKFGGGGTIERHDALCLLPHNILNEKIFIFQWFAIWILIGMYLILFAYRIVQMFSCGTRINVLHRSNRCIDREVVKVFTKKASRGNWWIMYVLSRNIDTEIYKGILKSLTKGLEEAYDANENGFAAYPDPHFATSSV